MVDKTVAISIRGNLFFNYIFSYEIFNKLYQRNAVKWQLLNIAIKQNSYGYALYIVYNISQ